MESDSVKPGTVTMRRLRATNPDYPLRDCYYDMLKRCYKPKQKNFCIYGGRGIRVCDEWRFSFAAFREWAKAHGWTPDLQIDRKDCDGDYTPKNCRFITSAKNNQNRRNNKLDVDKVAEIRHMLAEGFTGPEVAAKFGVHHSLIYRIKQNRNWKA